jgi:mannosyl-oligosaccharide alpha-1,2-mannosidase
VKEAFQHAWKGYKEHAWLHDEVKPLSRGHKDGYVGWAATLVDSLDSLYILDLQDEFAEALSALEEIDFSQPHAEQVPVFEVSIRYLGGLLGAWDVSGHQHPILLEKVRELGDFLYKAFNTESGVPVPYYDWRQPSVGKLPGETRVIIAQIGSLSMEFIRLSQVTGDKKYADAIELITNQLELTQNSTTLPGIWPTQVDTDGPEISFTSQSYTLGALAGKSMSLREQASMY